MTELPFSLELVRFLADRRTDLLTVVFQAFTFLGEVEGYVLLITLVYVTWDKQLAYRLSVVTLVAMSLNHLLKMVVMNPRPFVAEGTWAERWAVSPERAQELATEYSTPSGHAMAGSAFYAYLFASMKSRPLRTACILLILLTGFSRPYLGVHYLEDVLSGWVLGAALAVASIRYGPGISRAWGSFRYRRQLAIVAGASVLLWLTTRALEAARVDEQPLAYVGYVGFLFGVVAAFPLEERLIDFDPRSSAPWKKALRYAICVALVLGTLVTLDAAFEAVSRDDSLPGVLLRDLRYALAGAAGILLAPLLFVKLGLAERRTAPSFADGLSAPDPRASKS